MMRTDKIIISIIVPVYNVERYVHTCIQSIINIPIDSFEILLVDDGSTDSSGVICDSYDKEYQNIHVYHQKNQGLSAARNKGIKEAKGEYLLFIDSDDYVDSEIIIEMIRKVKDNPQLDVIFLSGVKVFKDGEQELLDQPFDRNCIVNKSNQEVLNYLAGLKKYPGSACTKLVKKDLIGKHEIYFEYGKTSEDLKWCLEVFLNASKFDVINRVYYFYRQERVGSITNSYNEKKLSCLIEIIKDCCMLAEKHEKAQQAIYSFMAYEYIIALLMYCYVRITIDKNKRIEYRKFFDKYSYLLPYRKDSRVKVVYYLKKIFGTEIIAQLVGVYNKIK